MPFDSSGTFNRDRSWAAEANANIKIRSDNHDTHDSDLANGLSSCLTKNGVTQPTADIPMNSKRLINLANPTQAQDAATKNYVDNFRTFPTSITMSGANANGQIIFSSPTGANGLSWSSAGVDMSFVGRPPRTSEISKQLVINAYMDASTHLTGDVVVFDERGMINNNGQLSNNLSTTNGTTWRTIAPGYGALLSYGSSGDFRLSSNDVASITNRYATVTLREFATIQNSGGSTILSLSASASGKQNVIWGMMGGERRWAMYLGDGLAESGTARVGSNYQIVSYDNAGVAPYMEMKIDRSSHTVTISGILTLGSQLNVDSIVQSTDAALILASTVNGTIYLRPNGATSSVEQTYLNSNGDFFISNDLSVGTTAPASYGTYLGAGFRSKAATSGGYGGHWMNFYWDGADVRSYVNTSFIGDIAWQCDYRIKKDIEPLPSTWEAIKRITPVRYTQKAYDIWEEDDRERWGFIAHELQRKLFKGAATGEKDGPDIQTPNLMAILAGLTRALQEAMARIETLEERAA